MRRWLPGLLLVCLLAAGRLYAQDPTQCTGTKNSDGLTFEDSGGAGAFSGTVTTACGSLTSANTNDSWITITSATTFSIQFAVAQNAMPSSRSGSVTAIFGSAPGGPVSFIFTLTQFAKLSLASSSLPTGAVGLPYSAQLPVTGGSNFSRSFSIMSGALPAGLGINGPNIGGTPTAPGAPSFTVQVRDVDPTTGTPFFATQSYTLTMNPRFALSTTSLPGATVGVAYSAAVAANGGIPPYAWSLSSGALPQMLSLDPNSGAISGTPNANTQGTYPLTIQVTDQANEVLAGPLTLHVAPPALTISTSSLLPVTEGILYNASLGANGGTPPYSWSGTGLPAWLHVSSTGQLSGTPPPGSAGSYSFNVSVQDSNSQSMGAALSLQVNPAPLVIVTTSPLPDGKEGTIYQVGFQASGGKGSYSWSASGLPVFLNLSAAGELSGTPTVGSAGPYSFTVTVSDTSGNKTSGTFSLKVDSQSSPNPLAITTSSLSSATEGIVYSTALAASGGTPPYSWSGTGLPAWLHVSSTGQLSGTPPPGSAGSYSFNVSVQDSNSQSTSAALSLQVNPAPLVIVTTSPLPDGKEGAAYHSSFHATGGKGSYTWTASGLPVFLNLSAGGGLSGTPTVGSAGPYSFTVTVSDTSGNKTSGTFSLKVDSQSSPNPLAITTSSLSPATEGIVYSTALAAIGGTQPYSWTGTGLPAWLHVSSTGELSGTPPSGSAGTYSFDVKVHDSNSASTSIALSLQVNPAPLVIVTTSPLPDGKEGVAYHSSFQATGGKGSYSWTASGLPMFLNLAANGGLSGTPTVGSVGLYSFTVTVSDTLGNKTSATFSFKVDSQSSSNPLAIVAPLLAPATEGGQYSATLTANGGTPPYSWTGTGLPTWLHISSTGQLSGTPPPGSSGTYTFAVNVQDANSQSTAITLSLQVNAAALAIATTSPLPDGKEGSAYGVNFQGIGGKSPYSWSAAGLPTFFSITVSGILSGKPPAGSAGTYSFIVTALDASGTKTRGTFSVTIEPLLSITVTPPVLEATEGHPYSVTFGVSGGTSPYVWSQTGLPSWASLSPGGLLTGTPPVGSAGGVQFTVTAKDAANNSESSQVTLLVLAANGGITITTASLPDAMVGADYQTTLSATGGTPPYQWTGSGIPNGLTLASNGELSGTPTSPGDSRVTAQATDANNNVAFAALSLHVAPSGLTIATPRPLPAGEVGLAYSTMFQSSGGTRPQSWSLVSGPLPAGLILDSHGVLSGTPTESGVFDFTLAVTELGSGESSLAKKPGGQARDRASNSATAAYEILVRPYVDPDLVVSCGSLMFDAPSQGSAPLQTCSLISTIFNSIPFTVTVDAPWLTVSPSGFTPGRIDVSVDSSGLAPGVYTATITLSSPGVASKTIAVTLTVHPAPTGLLQVSPTSLTISSPGSPALSRSVFLQNNGQGDVSFNVSVDAPWLKVTPTTGTLTAGATMTLQATALAPTLSPGAYLGNIEIDSSSGTNMIPVKLLISRKPRMILSRDGLLLVARQGNGVSGPAPSTFLIWSDSTDIHYAVEQLGGEGWLTLVSDQHGTATDSVPGTVAFQAKSAGLAKGAYYAHLRVTAFEPYDNLLDFPVVLDVEDSSEQPVPDPDPAGLVFAARGGPISAQTVSVYTSSDQPLPYQVAVSTDSGGDWLSATPLAGMLATSTSGQLSVSADASNLKPGIYRGGINISISNLEVRTVNVTLIVPGLSNSPSAISPHAVVPSATAPGCTPANLVLTETGLAGNFSTPAGWPGYLAVQLSDDCGNPILHADVVADFSNGDAPLSLTATNPKMAVYSATWTPVFSTSELTITLHAAAMGLQPATTQLVGGVTDTPYPILSQNSTVNNLYPRSGAPLAPGTIVAIYGSALAPAPTAANAQLPTILGGTSVFVGGELAPLYYVSGNQINAQLPFDLVPDQEYQLLVLANGGYSTPDTIRIDPATPGVARLANGQVIAQHQDFSPVTPSSPAKPGEYLVIYLAGMGLTDQTIAAGVLSPTKPLASVSVPATVTLGSEPVPVLFAGLSPGFVGLYQINFQVPNDAKSGTLSLQISQMGMAANTTVLVVGK